MTEDATSSVAKRMKCDDNTADSDALTSTTDNGKKSDLLKVADEAIQESNKRHVKPVIEESKFGIELFVGDTKDQYHGLIKTRYADFIVHEIDLDGNIAQLTNLEAPEEDEPTSTMKLEDFFDRKALVCMSNVNSGLLETYKIDVTGMDKDTRTSLHHAIRASYDRLESSTVSEFEKPQKDLNGDNKPIKDEDQDSKTPDSTQQVEGEGEANKLDKAELNEEKKYIVVTRRSKSSRPRNVWPRNRPDHTHFVLYKENKDTMDAIHNLAAATNTKNSTFSYAGTKDRRAVTTQWVSSWRLEPKRLLAAMRRFNKRPFIKAGNFCFKKDPIRLGQLRANKFDIVIRHLVHNGEGIKVIDDSMETVRDRGFVNYFGLQRFGTRSIQTNEVGLSILQAKWKQATDLILSYRYDDNTQPLPNAQENDQQQSANKTNEDGNESSTKGPERQSRPQNQKRNSWASGAEQHNTCIDLWKSKLDADLVFKKYPHFRMTNEGLLIKSLSKSTEFNDQDYANSLASLPRNTRSMYVHSYQSLLWNKLSTYRLKKHGFKVIPGDLILCPEAEISDNSLDILLTIDDPDMPENNTIDTNDNNGKDLADTAVENHKTPIDDIDSKIIIATEENLHKYTIFDVVLPIVGSRVKLPKNDVTDELERLLKEDDLTLESFRARERIFVSYGSYRKIMVKPNNMYWTIKQYSHPHENLVETDLDKLNREATNRDQDEAGSCSPVKSDSSDEALIVGFELPPSSYATMCLREMMKKPSTDFNNRF